MSSGESRTFVPSVVSRLTAAADGPGTITFVGAAAGGGAAAADVVRWAQIHDDALAMAGALQARGVGPGVHVGVLGPTTRPLVTALQAVWLAGGTVVTLPLPMRLSSIEAFVEQTLQRIMHADANVILVDPDLAPFVPDGARDGRTVLGLDELARVTGAAGAATYER